MRQDKLQLVARALLAMQRHSWEQGVAAQAFLELGDTDTAVAMAIEAVSRQRDDGRLAVIGDNDAVTDPGANGEPLIFAAELTKDPVLREAVRKMLDWFLLRAPRASDGTLYHMVSRPEVWVDSMYMAPPFIARAGHVDEAIRQIEGMRRRLWNPKKRMFSHRWHEGEQRFVREDCWGVGNGWAAVGMSRVLAAIPAHATHVREKLISYVREVLDGCLAHQRSDGLFHNVVDDPSSFVETNLAQMLAYTIYRGVEQGWLEEAYLTRADAMRSSAHGKVDEHGFVRGVCGAPDFMHPGIAPEGQAFFLLMEAAARDVRRPSLEYHSH